MSKEIIVFLIFTGILSFSIAMFVLSKVLRKNKAWVSMNSLLEFSADQVDTSHFFRVTEIGEYGVYVIAKRNLKITRPPLRKIDFMILDEAKNPVSIRKGIPVFKEISGYNISEVIYAIGEFKVSNIGNYMIIINGDDGLESTDRLMIKIKLSTLK